MELLMPSEVARLVYGYLKEEGCDEAAETFFQTSANLQECRMLASRGRIFLTRILDMSLLEFLDKYCTASSMLHERLCQSANAEEVKKTSDIVEQLKYLLEGARSQKIVVNIDVRSQNGPQVPRESPVILTTYRKRRHSNNIDKERLKKAKQNEDKPAEGSHNQNVQNLQATRLETLPGHINPTISDNFNIPRSSSQAPQTNNTERCSDMCSLQENWCQPTAPATAAATPLPLLTPSKCTMGTNTEELLSTCCAQVQTMPYFGPGSPYLSSSKEPLENLSAMLGGMLESTAFHETLAETINKGVLSEVGNNDSTMTQELNNRIRDAAATMGTTPTMEKMFSDIVGIFVGDSENEKTKTSSEASPKSAESIETEDMDCAATNALEDQNAAAVNGIMMINANIAKQATNLGGEIQAQVTTMEDTSPQPIEHIAPIVQEPAEPVGVFEKPELQEPPPQSLPTDVTENKSKNIETSKAEAQAVAKESGKNKPGRKTDKKPRKIETPVQTVPIVIDSEFPPEQRKYVPIAPKDQSDCPSLPHKLPVASLPKAVMTNTASSCNPTPTSLEVPPFPCSSSATELAPEARPLSDDTTGATENVAIANAHRETNDSMSFKDRCKDDMFVKRTPKSIMKSREKHHRLSSSTPRRRSSHVRALNFNTPGKLATTGKKVPNTEMRKLRNSSCRTSLFKSPPMMERRNSPSPKMKKCPKTAPVCRVPIATRSPAPKLCGAWDKYTGVGAILGSTSSRSSSSPSPSPSKAVVKKKRGAWDKDLRQNLTMNEDEQLQVLLNKSRQVEDDDKESKNMEAKKEPNVIAPKTAEDDVARAEAGGKDLEVSASQSSISNEDKPVKKYVQLKTLRSSTSKASNVDALNQSSHSEDPTKACADVTSYGCYPMPKMTDLETPQKVDFPLDIPPTPRIVTPGNSILLNIKKISDHSLSKIPSFIVKTPGMPPPTPCIKELGDSVKEYESSLYYLGPDREQRTTHNLESLQVCSVVAKVAQFEVVKENLTIEEAAKELKISVTSKDSESINMETGSFSVVKESEIVENTKSFRESLSNSDSDSDNDSSSSSCSTCSASSTCSTYAEDSMTKHSHSATKRKGNSSTCKKTPLKDESLKTNSSMAFSESMQSVSCSRVEQLKADVKCEASPAKVFPLNKTRDVEKECEMETPAKDEALLDEAVISETPCSSKAGFEFDQVTNLSNKISALIHSADTNKDVKVKSSQNPQIVSVTNLNIPVHMHPLPTSGPHLLESVLKPEHVHLQAELNKKRENVINKLKLGAAMPAKKNYPTKTGKVLKKSSLCPSNAPKKQKPDSTDEKVKMNEASNKTEKLAQAIGEEMNKEGDEKKLALKATMKSKRGRKDAEASENDKKGEKESPSQEKGCENVATTSNVNPAAVQKMKVDQVKRDLFSKNFPRGKMTTRSKTRQILDDKEVSMTNSSEEQSTRQERMHDNSTHEATLPEESNPELLEVLQLVPANKSDNTANYFEFFYDEEVRAKRRYRKYSNSELEMALVLKNGDEETQFLLTATPYEELFNISPKRKRPVRKEPGKVVKRTRKGTTKAENADSNLKEVTTAKPLASSTPAFKAEIAATKGNVVDLGTLKESEDSAESKKNVGGNKKVAPTKEEITSDKTEDLQPKETLSKVDLDNFLKNVHGSAR